ncbi:hypothetical protein N0V94_001089 [Neodidymelliopsis sp. IMI 364377]|nr:hypothetical protein N0V94_001089 [Neodidymelliopsis sp. IMI 364377]
MALWVGMRPSSADSLRTRAARGNEKMKKSDGAQPKVTEEDIPKVYGKSVDQIIANGQYHLVQRDPQALRVVMNPLHRDGKVYVLANPDSDGLCQAIVTKTDKVWYAPEYRDDAQTQKQKQKSAITNKIYKYVDETQNKGKAVHMDLTSNARDFRRLVTAYRLSGEVGKLKSLRDREKFGDTIALDRLIDPTLKSSKEDESCALDALKPLSHDEAYHVLARPGVISGLATGVRAIATPLRYAELKFILVDWAQKVESGRYFNKDGSIDNPGGALVNTLEGSRWFHIRQTPTYGVDDDDASDENTEFVTLFLRHHIRTLKAFSDGTKQNNQPKNSASRQAVVQPPSCISRESRIDLSVQRFVTIYSLIWVSEVVR